MVTALDIKEAQERFLESFIEAHGDSQAARDASGVARKTFFRWLEDREFRDRFDQYRILLSEDLENEAVRRIMGSKGKGGKGTDLLLMKTLAGLKPERYRDQPTGNDNRTVIYISNVRTVPRPGVEVLDASGAPAPSLEHHQDDPVRTEGDQDGGVAGADAQDDARGPADSEGAGKVERRLTDVTESRPLYRLRESYRTKPADESAGPRPRLDDADKDYHGRLGGTDQ